MRTPSGSECPYFYGDYARGRNREECRLLGAAKLEWSPALCRTCPVPSITRANACESMRLQPQIVRPLLNFFRKQVQVTAYCEKSRRTVSEPQVGCGQCHPLPPEFRVKS